MQHRRFSNLAILITLVILQSLVMVHAEQLSRPGKESGKPTQVQYQVYIIDIDSINTAEQSFAANVFYALHWEDPRLAHSTQEPLIIPLSKIWHPNVHILNIQKVWKTFPELVEVSPDGKVTYRQRIWGHFSQPLKLYKFPFDKQHFELKFVSIYHPGKVEFIKHSQRRSGISKIFSLPDWKIVQSQLNTKPQNLLEGNPINASFVFTITAKRYVEFYALKFMVPLLLIVIMSFLAFWINPSESGSRINVTVTAMLTLIAYRFVIATLLPKVSYMTRLDIFILSATLLVFLSVILASICSLFMRHQQVKKVMYIDRVCRVCFPILLIIIIILPFLIH